MGRLVVVATVLVMLVSAPPTGAQSPKATRKAQKLLEKLKLVDGTGSGLDADRLQGATLAEIVAQVLAQASRCSPDAVRVGETCVDAYEASVWQIATTDAALAAKVQAGTATLDDLVAGGAVPLGCTAAPFNQQPYPPGFPADGNWTPVFGSSPPSPGVYAVSIPGVMPSGCTSWFRAEQACALAGKRLITNAEWQRAVAGTPDPGLADNGSTTCATSSPTPVPTGSRSACVSSWGLHDMVGNVAEWVADWAPFADGCGDWQTTFGLTDGDASCMGRLTGTSDLMRFPGPFYRGGSFVSGHEAGALFVKTNVLSMASSADAGFRCAR